jgi:tight adherence protein B
VIVLAELLVGVASALAAASLTGVMPRSFVPHRAHRRLSMQRAALGVSPLGFWSSCAAAGVIAFVVLSSLSGSWFVALVPASAVALLPRTLLARHQRRQVRAIQEAWPDGLRDLLASIAAGSSLTQGLCALATHGPEPLRVALGSFPGLVRVIGAVPAFEVLKQELADPTSDRVIEVLIVAHERGGPVVRAVLEELIISTTRDLKMLEAIETEGLEMRINARVVVVLPWLILVAFTARDGPFRAFYRSSAGLVTLVVAAALTGVGVAVLARLGREPIEPRVLGLSRTHS